MEVRRKPAKGNQFKDTVLSVDSIRFSVPDAEELASTFDDGRSIRGLVEDLQMGRVSPVDVPTIRVTFRFNSWYSLDNRRLKAFKEAQVKEVPVLVRKGLTRELKEKMNYGTNSASRSFTTG